mmetsp:Transcript_13683/g.20734  ORF Transcript_13683/g.20734 Transcript_13683/m.20734 type:complete len:1116 (-) Transcript_13683:7-3354(-)
MSNNSHDNIERRRDRTPYNDRHKEEPPMRKPRYDEESTRRSHSDKRIAPPRKPGNFQYRYRAPAREKSVPYQKKMDKGLNPRALDYQMRRERYRHRKDNQVYSTRNAPTPYDRERSKTPRYPYEPSPSPYHDRAGSSTPQYTPASHHRAPTPYSGVTTPQRSGEYTPMRDDDKGYSNRYNLPTPRRNVDGSFRMPHRMRRGQSVHEKYSRPRSKMEIRVDGDELNQFERTFYNSEETMDVSYYRETEMAEDWVREKEQAYKEQMQQKMSLKSSHYLEQNQKWEEQQLRVSGVKHIGEVDMEAIMSNEDEQTISLIVHDVKPPFLDDSVSVRSKITHVEPITDPTCDMVQIARRGSDALRKFRAKRERIRAQRDSLSVANTQLGKLTGAKNLHDDDDDEEDDELSTKNFAQSMGNGQTERAKIKRQRESLPIFKSKGELLNVMEHHNVVVIVGETGSGKTTQLAQYLHESGYSKFGMIGVTQPRRVAAMSVAKRVSDEMGCELGSTVGYAIRFEDCTSDQTKIKYMTDGVLLRECLFSEDLDQYSCIIMDEAHERSLNTDVLFGLLKKVVSKRRDIKLIVTSATMDSDKFSNFFGSCPIYHIPGRTFPVEIRHSDKIVLDYVDAAVQQAISIHVSNSTDTGDILIFMTGQEDIEITCYILRQRLREHHNASPLMVLPIYSMLPSELQAKIFDKPMVGTRKCIVATNIAETSLTVDGIYYVIDTGFCKFKVYNPKISMDALQVYPESKAAANQRAGRAGRTGPGTCYRLYTKEQYENEMLPNTVPEIQRTNLGNVVLLLKSLGVDDALSFDFMDPPPGDNMKNSMFQLWMLGALDNMGNLTDIGRKMVEFPLGPSLSKMLIASEGMGCSSEIVTIVSMLSVPTIFYRPKGREVEADQAREKFLVPESDHLSLLHIYDQWKRNSFSPMWCKEYFLNYKALRKVKEIRSQLVEIMDKLHITLVSCQDDRDQIRKAICFGYFHNAAKLKGIGQYLNLLTGMQCELHPTSALYGMGFTPTFVIYHELILTTQEYMRCTTAVEGEWLAEVAPLFYSMKKTAAEAREARRKARIEREKMELDLKELREQKELEANAKALARKKRDLDRLQKSRKGRVKRRFGL